MRTDPFTDAWGFLIGATADHQALGAARYLIVALFIALLAASAAIALANWPADPGQRTAAHLWTWLFRVLLGIMWFQGSLWKLPLPDAAGLQYWTEQMAEHAAFPFYADLVRHVMLPHMTIVDPLVFLAEMGLAVSFMLGFAVKPIATLGAMYTLGLWIGLYRHPGECHGSTSFLPSPKACWLCMALAEASAWTASSFSDALAGEAMLTRQRVPEREVGYDRFANRLLGKPLSGKSDTVGARRS